MAARGLPIEFVGAFDRAEHCLRTYRLNHPWPAVCMDLLTDVVDWAGLGPVDVVVGGVPCEWISSYRTLQKPKADETQIGQALLDRMLSIVEVLRPSFWALEDVVGLVRHLPILTPHQVIDARGWSGQRRKRVYVGHFPPPHRNGRAGLLLRDYVRPGPYRIGPRLSGRRPEFARTFSRDSFLAASLGRKAPTVLTVGSQRDAEMGIVDESLCGGVRQMEWQEAAGAAGLARGHSVLGVAVERGPSDRTIHPDRHRPSHPRGHGAGVPRRKST
jgi:site-specific DNA-cytosine methylase